jgi:uncharacterized phosphatase
VKHLYFVRHGLSEANKAGIWSGQRQTPLSPEGYEQAHEAGKAAKDLSIDLIVCSPFERTVDTAKIIADEIGLTHDNIIPNKLFIERGLGELEGKPWKIEHSIDDYEGVETRSSLFARMKYAQEYLESLPADTILVVGHGASGRALRHVINPEIPFQGPGVKRLPNGQIIKFM